MLMTGYNETDQEENDEIDDKTSRMKREREEELCDMFMMFDKDKDGSISIEELSRVMVTFGGLDKDELDIMINEADENGDGQVRIKTTKKSKRSKTIN